MSFIRNIILKLVPPISNSGCRNYHRLKTWPSINHPNLKISDYYLVNPKRHLQHKSVKCWQCGIERKNISELFCEQCNFIQSPQDSDNYFKIFDLEETFHINQKDLTAKYRKLQSQLHPDKFTNKSDEEKNISDEFSSLVNKAYHVLQTPLKRAIHLLYLKGESIQEGQKVEDPEFLMEIMELNEEVENADSADKLIKLKQKNETELEKISSDISEAFGCNKIAEAKNLIIKMKYYNSINVHINALMREQGIVE